MLTPVQVPRRLQHQGAPAAPAEVQAAMAKIQHWMLAKSYLEDELRSLIQRLQPGRALNHDVPARPEREHPPLGGRHVTRAELRFETTTSLVQFEQSPFLN